jgi:hypothetical protein
VNTLSLTRAAALTATTVAAVSCGSPAAPTAGSPPAATVFTVSGTVFENVGNERRPLASADVYRFVDAPGGGSTTHVATTDARGRYVLAGISPGSQVALTVPQWMQPCAAVAAVTRDLQLDIDIVKGPSDRAPQASPALAGRVFHAGNGPRRPYIDGAAISFFSASVGGGHPVVARTMTDHDGRFELCRLPPGPAMLYVQTWEDTVAPRTITVAGDAAIEIEVPPALPSPPPAPPPNIDGTYVLQLESSCANIPVELRRRTYTATVTGSPNVVVRLSGASFWQHPGDGLLNAFTGTTAANPDRAVFDVSWPPATQRWGIVEQISPTTLLELVGRGGGPLNGTTIEGALAGGGIGYGEDLRDDSRHTGCSGPIFFRMSRR